MHLLYSHAIGTEVMDEEGHHLQGIVRDLLIDPDRGKILALLVQSPYGNSLLALLATDILSWGKRVHCRSNDVLGPIEEVIRLQPFLQEKRTVIRQRIRMKSGGVLGTCTDVQFNTKTMDMEWIFPRKFLMRGLALPVSEIVEITEDAIIVKDQGPREEKKIEKETEAEPDIEPIIATAPSRSTNPS